MAGGSEQKLPSHPLPRAVATARVAPPPAHAVSVHPGRCCARIRSRTSPSTSAPGFPPLARSELPTKRNPSRHRVRARAPPRHSQSSSTTLSNRCHRTVRRRIIYALTKPCIPGSPRSPGILGIPRALRRASPSIASPSSSLRPHRPLQYPRGELADLPDLFPLFRVVQVVVTVAVLFRRRSVSQHRRAPLSFPSSPVTNSQRRLHFMVRK